MGNQHADKFDELQRQVEQILAKRPLIFDEAQVEKILHGLHELYVYQLELKQQNEDLHRAQSGLEASHRNYLELYDFAPVGYLTLDKAGRIIEANLTCAARLGMARDSLMQRTFSQFVFADDQDIYNVFNKQLFEAVSPQCCELRLNIQIDPPVYVKLDGITRTNSDGEITHVWLVMSDISAKKLAEKQAALLTFEREKIEQVKLDLLRTFLENATHNLRTPLTIAKTILFLLEQHSPLEHQKPRLSTLRDQVNHLSEMLENMMSLLHMSESADFEFGYLDLNLLVKDVVDEQRPLAEQQGLICTFRPSMSVSQVWADRVYLASAISNLVVNAMKYTPAGGKILVWTDKRDTNAEICVQDTGIGIDDADLPHIFERFFRSNLAISTQQHGTGLGLAIAEKIIKAHRGHIEVESELGKGSTFRINLPIDSGEAQ